jgi:hypothetical protein
MSEAPEVTDRGEIFRAVMATDGAGGGFWLRLLLGIHLLVVVAVGNVVLGHHDAGSIALAVIAVLASVAYWVRFVRRWRTAARRIEYRREAGFDG